MSLTFSAPFLGPKSQQHFSVSYVFVHSPPPEISVKYFLFITTVIYNYICYRYVVNFIITTANTSLSVRTGFATAMLKVISHEPKGE